MICYSATLETSIIVTVMLPWAGGHILHDTGLVKETITDLWDTLYSNKQNIMNDELKRMWKRLSFILKKYHIILSVETEEKHNNLSGYCNFRLRPI
jgi:hypothetical protein